MHHACPLFDLTGAKALWKWGSNQEDSFDGLCASITSTLVLTFAEDSKHFRVEADSSDFVMGAVLLQLSDNDGKWHPIAFYSKSLNAVERNYEIHDKEMLAIICALKEWRHFLEGSHHKSKIWTDHKNLEYFMTAKKLNQWQARWSLYLSPFDFSLHHQPGRSMEKPDALSRHADHGDRSADNDNIMLLMPELFVIRALEGITVEGEERDVLQEICQWNHAGEQEDLVVTAAKALQEACGNAVRSSEWKESDGLLLFRDRIYC